MSKRGCAAYSVGVLALLALTTGAAWADDPPTLVGTWKGNAYAVQIGANPYRPEEGTGPSFPSAGIEFSFAITEQKGNRFAGTSSGGPRGETLIGAISPDNRTGVILDDDGEYAFTIRDAETLDVCYRHSIPKSRVVACYGLKRSAR